MTVYHTATQEDYDALMVELEGEGFVWNDGSKPTEVDRFLVYKENTCVKKWIGNVITSGHKLSYMQLNNLYMTEYKAKKNQKDNINKPTHYHSGNIDVIKFSEENFSKEEQKGFHRINAIKYITRYDRKNGVEDLNKAKFYIDKLIEMEEQPHE